MKPKDIYDLPKHIFELPGNLYKGVTRNLQSGGRQIGSLVQRFVKPSKALSPTHPGALVYQGEERSEPVRLTIIDYDQQRHEQKEVETVEDCCVYSDKDTTTWINVSGVHDTDIIEKLGAHYQIHPLVLEDIVHTNQRPKLENHGSYFYIVFRMLQFDESRGEIVSEQISLLVGKGWVITFQETHGDIFDSVRERARNNLGRIRKFREDYLAYSLIDAVVDNYFVVLEKSGDNIEVLEEVIRLDPSPDSLHRIHHLKREMIYLRKSVWPLREVINQMSKEEIPLIRKATEPYLRDVYDHTIQIIETIETFRDMLSGLQDLYLSMVSNRMNDVMKVLTIIATVFIPPTFVAGIYGMNFENMPELSAPHGYFIALGVMLASILSMLMYFRWKKWL